MRKPELHILRILGLLLAIALCAQVAVAAKEGYLVTSDGKGMTANELDQMISSFVPPGNQKLIVLTQCYGGNMASHLGGSPNTSVASATSSGQKAYYGGYDDDSAGALKPEAGRTGQNVHDAGTAGKNSAETPSTAGTPLSGFSLEPVTPGGNVESRHIVVYAGKPDSKGRDDAVRDKIKSNFAGQPNTTVTAVGGNGTGGWDKPGTREGLRQAMIAVQQAIASSAHPEKEQFIFYATDHGGLREAKPVATFIPSGGGAAVPAVPSLSTGDIVLEPGDLINPGFEITLDFSVSGPLHPAPPFGYVPFFNPGDITLWVDPDGAAGPLLPIELVNFEELYIDIDGDGMIGSMPDEGVTLHFDMDPEFWVDSFFDVTYDVEIFNNSPVEIVVTEVAQDSGAVAKRGIPGDYTGNGVVDQADYTLWADTFNNDGSPGMEDLRADGNGDNLVDTVDYVIWADHFGEGQPPLEMTQSVAPAVTEVLEPVEGEPAPARRKAVKIRRAMRRAQWRSSR